MKRISQLAGCAVLPLLLAACHSAPEPKEPAPQGQSYAEALRVMCDVDKIGAISAEDPFEAGRMRTEVIKDKVDNPDAIYLRTMLSVKGPSDQATELRKEAKGAGVEPCVLADELDKTGVGGIAP